MYRRRFHGPPRSSLGPPPPTPSLFVKEAERGRLRYRPVTLAWGPARLFPFRFLPRFHREVLARYFRNAVSFDGPPVTRRASSRQRNPELWPDILITPRAWGGSHAH